MPQMLNGGITVVVAPQVTLSDTAPPVVLGPMWVGCTPREACTGVASNGIAATEVEIHPGLRPTCGPQSVGP
jgi:hypothetical protein